MKSNKVLNQIGVWLDHRQAMIVKRDKKIWQAVRILSHVEKQRSRAEEDHVPGTRFKGSTQPGDHQDNAFHEHLNRYYGEVVSFLRGADEILLFGPGEGKGELQKMIAKTNPKMVVVGLETTDKMTDEEIINKVSQYFS